MVRLPRSYEPIYKQYFLPHLLRVGYDTLGKVSWEWFDPSLVTDTSRIPRPELVREQLWGLALAQRIIAAEGLYNSEEGYEYAILPIPMQRKQWFARVQLLTVRLRWQQGAAWPPVGVMITNFITYESEGPANLAGVLLIGSKEERAELRRQWLVGFGEAESYQPPDLGPGWG